IAVALALVGGGLWWWARRMARRSGLPAGRVVYSDAAEWRAPPKPLRSDQYGLTGKPDYLVAQGDDLIPIEVKPSRRARQPYEGDVLQLAAYCLLVESSSGRRPPHGLIVYADQQWEIPYTDARRETLLAILAAIRADRQALDVPRSHEIPARCAHCGFLDRCEDALVEPGDDPR
ncbi:MAG TPA: Dna2/Cas4 domain-containing protein, partial [Ardenticatenaceae bacterium]|nr:Dna2/Cas4 domain-containing protein [Ardenticatenaceae bacterium]